MIDIQDKNQIKSNNLKPICSFVNRSRQLSGKKQEFIKSFGNDYLISSKNDLTTKLRNLTQTNNSLKQLVLEIGFGEGENLFYLAQNYPKQIFIGIEVYPPAIYSLLSKLSKNPLQNILIYQGDAKEFLTNYIINDSLAKILLFFPDPWPKRKHHKRRLIQKDFIELVATKLCYQGIFHLATDWQDYAEHSLKVISNTDALVKITDFATLETNSTLRAKTKFELRGIRLGHKIHDLIFIKNSNCPKTMLNYKSTLKILLD